MVKGIFDIRNESGYDDDIRHHYQFDNSSKYLGRANSFVGDWILYREPKRKGGRKAYVASAKVISVDPDHSKPDSYYVRVGEFQWLPKTVPIQKDGRYFEAPMRAASSPADVGKQIRGEAVREILDDDFFDILQEAYGELLTDESAVRLGFEFPASSLPPLTGGMAEDYVRPRRDVLLSKAIRDAAFRNDVLNAYDSQCAVTGLKIINGGGRAEVEAAHIQPVMSGGPDVVQNGIALSKTIHWLFDRHLISIDEDYRLLVADNRIPAELRGLFPGAQERIRLPANRDDYPEQRFLAYHREHFASGH